MAKVRNTSVLLSVTAFIVLAAGGTYSSPSHAAEPIATAQPTPPELVQEPEFADNYFLLDATTGALSPLERKTAVERTTTLGLTLLTSTTDIRVPGDRSPVRFPQGQQLSFVVKTASLDSDPQSWVHFASMKTLKHKREVLRRYMISDTRNVRGMTRSEIEAQFVPFTARKYGTSSIIIIPNDSLVPGEYCVRSREEAATFCFGIDSAGHAAPSQGKTE